MYSTKRANRLTREHNAGAHFIHIPTCPVCVGPEVYEARVAQAKADAKFMKDAAKIWRAIGKTLSS